MNLDRTFVVALLLGAVLLASPGIVAEECEVIPAGGLRYRVFASKPRLNRKLVGEVTRWVKGVPAEPVDSFVYDGDGSTPVEGQLSLIVDPTADVGVIHIEWSDENGEWTYDQSRFIHPEHLSGVRIGASVDTVDFIINEGIAENVYLHGDTAAGLPVLPTVFTHLSSWGPADVTRNGNVFRNPFELPAPQWLGHVMVTEGVRLDDGSVRALTGAVYDPAVDASRGAVNGSDLEVHVVFHDERFPVTGNFPPLFSFFYHLVFEDVAIELVQADEPISTCPPSSMEAAGPGPLRDLPRRR